jgi:hypothetical protein
VAPVPQSMRVSVTSAGDCANAAVRTRDDQSAGDVMSRPRTIYTEHTVKLVKNMLMDGAGYRDIAIAIGTTVPRLSVRLKQLGIQRPRPQPDQDGRTMSVRIPIWLVKKYAPFATSRNMKTRNLMCAVLMRVAEDNLFLAILDDGK